MAQLNYDSQNMSDMESPYHGHRGQSIWHWSNSDQCPAPAGPATVTGVPALKVPALVMNVTLRHYDPGGCCLPVPVVLKFTVLEAAWSRVTGQGPHPPQALSQVGVTAAIPGRAVRPPTAGNVRQSLSRRAGPAARRLPAGGLGPAARAAAAHPGRRCSGGSA